MKYNPALTGLRAVAALLVLAFHSSVPVTKGGYYGVTIFFVLSGFLITSILRVEVETTGSIRLWRFYWNRFVRLTPPLLLLLAALFILGLSTPGEVAIYGLYLTDFHMMLTHFEPERYATHLWSLSIEEHFYLVWPAVMLVLLRTNRPLPWIVGFLAIATLWRIATMPWFPGPATYYRLDARLTGLLLGAVVAFGGFQLARDDADRVFKYCACVLGLAIVGMRQMRSDSLLAMTVVEFASAGVLVACLHEGSVAYRLLSKRPLELIGLWSYSIYLWHYPIAKAFNTAHISWTVAFPITLAGGLALGATTYYLIERPARRLRLGRSDGFAGRTPRIIVTARNLL